MTDPGGGWLADLGPAPPPWRLSRPRADALVVQLRSGWFPAAFLASVAALLFVPIPVAAFTGSWPAALVAWLASTLALASFLARPTRITLTPSALSIEEGRAPPRVVPWDLVERVELRREPEPTDPEVVHSPAGWGVAGPPSPHVAVGVRRAPIGPNAETLRLAAGLDDPAVDWLHRAILAAWNQRGSDGRLGA